MIISSTRPVPPWPGQVSLEGGLAHLHILNIPLTRQQKIWAL